MPSGRLASWFASMVQKLKIYIETSVVRAYHDTRFLQRLRETRRFWSKLPRYHVIISDVVVDHLIQEYESYTGPARAALELLKDFETVVFDAEASRLAMAYIRKQVFREDPVRTAVHMAMASAQSAHYVLSWYYGARLDAITQDRIGFINFENGFSPIRVVLPSTLIGGPK